MKVWHLRMMKFKLKITGFYTAAVYESGMNTKSIPPVFYLIKLSLKTAVHKNRNNLRVLCKGHQTRNWITVFILILCFVLLVLCHTHNFSFVITPARIWFIRSWRLWMLIWICLLPWTEVKISIFFPSNYWKGTCCFERSETHTQAINAA